MKIECKGNYEAEPIYLGLNPYSNGMKIEQCCNVRLAEEKMS